MELFPNAVDAATREDATAILANAAADTNVLACTCDTAPDTDCPVCDVSSPDEFDMDAAATLITVVTGVPAFVEQTGGGCATIYVGPDRDNPVLTAGPGSFAWRGPHSVGSTLELGIGLNADVFGDEHAYGPGAQRDCPDMHASPETWLAHHAAELLDLAATLKPGITLR